ncbi:sugar ABC transporter substrate-binding protein [candidate division KSB3 bacterium]|uniref:Sugar ABC transporter substrate-binding protein n=1 Tax=candidate division KSB3 bacterium TaxID=2044937 RepID=A0A2G6E407_9BACT|nr:MAG: sugar ABC transporter substrate-binding protein [candidate division KSB3 bacterium]PIE29407.1 MAG: sugar ABC transporter substrate-binding protein [candidate division KSB3 bacterium]
MRKERGRLKIGIITLAVIFTLLLLSCPAVFSGETFPAGEMVLFSYGNPQYRLQYFDDFLARNSDIAPGVTVKIVQTKGEADVRQKVQMSYTAAAYDELPDAISTAPVSMQAMAEAGILVDMTDLVESVKDKFVEGSFDQILYDGRYYGFPRSLRPQLLFYNIEIFDKYGIDPKEMDTIEGWIEVGRTLKEASNGEVFLSYIDPGSRTWRYYGRRGFMPQANARIWDDDGNIVIDKDPGTKLAFETLDTLYREGLLLKSAIFKPSLYDATREGKVATFYIGAFWSEFLRQNLPDMEGKWRVMPAPVFQDIGTRGAPVVAIEALIKKPEMPYAELYKKYLLDFNFNGEARNAWTTKMVEQNAPYPNPMVLELLADPFWKEPSAYYGGQSFREMEGLGLQNPSENLRVTTHDAEADQIISAELEKYVAGDQTMAQAIENMGKVLKDRIGKTTAAK